MLDSRYTILTPEGIELPVHVAGAPARALAWLLDVLIMAVLLFVLSFLVGLMMPKTTSDEFSGDAGEGLLLLLYFFIMWGYDVFFEVWGGGTPGKRAMGLRVLHTNGTPIGLRSSFIRNILRPVDFLPLCYALGLISLLLSQKFQRLGDILGGTVVVYREHLSAGVPMASVASTPPPAGLSLEDRQTLLLFAERYATLSPQRRAELAQRLAFLVPEQNASDPAPVLLAYANWLIRG